jgi:DNA mismatch endonuclease (patch repair protein)
MRSNTRRNTKPEVALSSALHRTGLRFRRDHRVVAGDVKVRPDFVFTRARIAVFLDGCFWHSCPDHATRPSANSDYWQAKLARNRERDRTVNAALADDGWNVLRFWEHDEPAQIAEKVAAAVQG